MKIDYFLEGLKRGLNPTLGGEYEDICLRRDEAIEKYNKAIENGDVETRDEQADIILQCQFKTQELLMRRCRE